MRGALLGSVRDMTGNEKTEARKIKILECATRIFAEKGFQDATIAEIARAARASEASVYDYFTTKENLLFSIPKVHMQALHEKLVFHLQLVRGSLNKLHAILYLQLLYYKEHPEFTAVLMLILKHDRKFINTEAHKAIRDYLKILDKCLEEGVANGELRSDINLYYVRCALVGALEHIVINWLIRGKPEDLMEAIDPIYNININLLQKRQPVSECPLARSLAAASADIRPEKTPSAS